jgi:hypothetical protein
MIDAISQIIIEFVLIYPGAGMRWFFLKNKKSFRTIVKDNILANLSISLALFGLIAFIAISL